MITPRIVWSFASARYSLFTRRAVATRRTSLTTRRPRERVDAMRPTNCFPQVRTESHRSRLNGKMIRRTGAVPARSQRAPSTSGKDHDEHLRHPHQRERFADLDLDQLRQLVGLVQHGSSTDPFPLTGWDAMLWVVGNATQTSHFFQSAFGMQLVAYSGPTTGNRDHHAYVSSERRRAFRHQGRRAARQRLIEHHREHGDGIIDISLTVPDVDKCIEHVRSQGATVLAEPHATSPTTTAPSASAPSPPTATRATRWWTVPPTPGPIFPDTSRAPRHSRSATAHPSESSRRSTILSATSSWATWTTGSSHRAPRLPRLRHRQLQSPLRGHRARASRARQLLIQSRRATAALTVAVQCARVDRITRRGQRGTSRGGAGCLATWPIVVIAGRRFPPDRHPSQSSTAAAVHDCCMLPNGSPVNGS